MMKLLDELKDAVVDPDNIDSVPTTVPQGLIRRAIMEIESQGSWPKGFVNELLTLLDRIEIQDDTSLAIQRFDIAEKYGFVVVVGDR